MMRFAPALGLTILIASTSIASAVDTTGFTKEQATLLGQFANAWLSTRECDFNTDEQAIFRAAQKAFGPSMPLDKVISVLGIVHEFEDFGREFLFAHADEASKTKSCKDLMNNFGPQGKIVPGLIVP